MIEEPLVSVLMTAYNRAQYIGEAIESVLASSYTNFELIIVDDCSTDGTVALAKACQSKDARVKIFLNDSNLGDYPNRNKAASYAQGKYIKYVDSDDSLYRHSLAIMVEAMEQFPSAAYGFSYRQQQRDETPFPILYTPRAAYNEHFLKGGFFYAGPGSSIIRKDAFDKISGFSGKQYVGDFEMWLKLSADNDCLVFQPGLLWWRKHTGHQFQLGIDGNHYLLNNFALSNVHLKAINCPLDNKEKALSLLIQQVNFIRKIVYAFLFKKRAFKTFYSLFRQYHFKLQDLVMAFLPLQWRIKLR